MLGRVNVGEVVIFLISPTPSSAAGKFYQNHENQSKPMKRFIRAPVLSTILGGGGLISTEKLAPSEKKPNHHVLLKKITANGGIGPTKSNELHLSDGLS